MNTTDKQTQDLFAGKAVSIWVLNWRDNTDCEYKRKAFSNEAQANDEFKSEQANYSTSPKLTKYTITSIEELAELINKLP